MSEISDPSAVGGFGPADRTRTGLDWGALWQLLRLGLIGFGILAAILWVLAQWNEGGAGNAVDAATGTVTLTLAQEPPQMDSTRGTDQVSFRILGHVMEGLLRYDANNRLVGVVEARSRDRVLPVLPVVLFPNDQLLQANILRGLRRCLGLGM